MRVRGTCGLRPPVLSGASLRSPSSKRRCRAHRLVTLIGVGGVAKTRLATEVAARLADEFPDGVWLFELAAVSDPAAVPDAVAAVLGVTQQPGKRVSDSVAAALEGRVRLLVFDNCEHVLDAAADLVEAILAQSSTVRIVATSREGLGIGDGQLWPVLSLDIGSAAVECLSNAPAMWRHVLRLPTLPRRARSSRFAGASTASRRRSSWRPHGWRR